MATSGDAMPGGTAHEMRHPAATVATPTILPGSPALPYGMPPPQRPSGVPGWAIALIVLGTVVVVIFVLGILAAIAIPVFQTQHAKDAISKAATNSGITAAQLAAPPYCGSIVTPDMPPATAAYVAALTRENDRLMAIDTLLSANPSGGIAAQQRSDALFLADLRRITFTGSALAPAKALASATRTYDAELATRPSATGSARAGVHARLDAATTKEMRAGGALRHALNLPRGTCAFLRPM